MAYFTHYFIPSMKRLDEKSSTFFECLLLGLFLCRAGISWKLRLRSKEIDLSGFVGVFWDLEDCWFFWGHSRFRIEGRELCVDDFVFEMVLRGFGRAWDVLFLWKKDFENYGNWVLKSFFEFLRFLKHFSKDFNM